MLSRLDPTIIWKTIPYPALKKKTGYLTVNGVGNSSSKALFCARILAEEEHDKVIWIAESYHAAKELYDVLSYFQHTYEITLLLEKKIESLNCEASIIADWSERSGHQMMIVTQSIACSLGCAEASFFDETMHLGTKPGQVADRMTLLKYLVDHGYSLTHDNHLNCGEYMVRGAIIDLVLPYLTYHVRLEFDDDQLETMYAIDADTGHVLKPVDIVAVYPLSSELPHEFPLIDLVRTPACIITDEIEERDEYDIFLRRKKDTLFSYLFRNHSGYVITAFPDNSDFVRIGFVSCLKYYSKTDWVNDMKSKLMIGWHIAILTKHTDELIDIAQEAHLAYTTSYAEWEEYLAKEEYCLLISEYVREDSVPHSFQHVGEKILFLTDKELFSRSEVSLKKKQDSPYLDFIMSLKPKDYVVHADHGIGLFQGLMSRTIDMITREYLEIHYADNDKVFVPVDQSDKITKYIWNDDTPPTITRLHSQEWCSIQKKVKRETERIAKELLELYAKRELAQGFSFSADNIEQQRFEDIFPYELTPGQRKAIYDVKTDMEKIQPMDRLVCGDVGFGKTEIALRAAFKAVQDKKQVAFLSPITILVDQHYKTFFDRLKDFPVRIAMLSRFCSKKEQTETLKGLKQGSIDIVIGTHRLLQTDVVFKDLGLVIVDEEQRFGVKDKEKIKSYRAGVDLLTLTATPIPRTLNMSLHRLRDITTITTPPPLRLPVITEVRKFSDELIAEVIEDEIKRDGQVFFLHNSVKTIEGIADKVRMLVPNAKCVVAHGQMASNVLEERIVDFTQGKYNVLVSSTIIENGIDLPNANTLIVNNATDFGLSQLYQLRGRVGRGTKQAYSYLLYKPSSLTYEARKRLRAIVEASELGSGFQIAMKDLEIRGAGDVLGTSQHGTMQAVGIGHFIRLLHQTIDRLKQFGQDASDMMAQEKDDIAIDIPVSAYIPDTYISDYQEKIIMYQKLALARTDEEIYDLIEYMLEEYGQMPKEVDNLCHILILKTMARGVHISSVKVRKKEGHMEYTLLLGGHIRPEQIFHLISKQPSWKIGGSELLSMQKTEHADWYGYLRESLALLAV